TKPRVAWVMIPAGITGATVEKLAGLFEDGDIVIDGGNSNYRDDIHRADAVKHIDPLLKTIAPGVETAPRTPGADGEPSTAEQGYLHCGPNGAGHFVKMVHNGIEYGVMAAYAEGLGVLE